jgi:hypothetical protein
MLQWDDQLIQLERLGQNGDIERTRRTFAALDGKVDALGFGGSELYIRLDERVYPLHATLKLIRDVHQTPVVDGAGLKHTLERRVFELAAQQLGQVPHFRRAFIPLAIDRLGLAQAVSEVTDEVTMGDLMVALSIPVPVRGLATFRALARLLLPLVCHLPLSALFYGSGGHEPRPRYQRQWKQADLIAGDFLYIRQYMPDDLSGKTIVTNTTTEANMSLLRARGVRTVITTTPRYRGRSFGTNALEAALTAFAGKGRALSDPELNALIDRLELHPSVRHLNP